MLIQLFVGGEVDPKATGSFQPGLAGQVVLPEKFYTTRYNQGSRREIKAIDESREHQILSGLIHSFGTHPSIGASLARKEFLGLAPLPSGQSLKPYEQAQFRITGDSELSVLEGVMGFIREGYQRMTYDTPQNSLTRQGRFLWTLAEAPGVEKNFTDYAVDSRINYIDAFREFSALGNLRDIETTGGEMPSIRLSIPRHTAVH